MSALSGWMNPIFGVPPLKVSIGDLEIAERQLAELEATAIGSVDEQLALSGAEVSAIDARLGNRLQSRMDRMERQINGIGDVLDSDLIGRFAEATVQLEMIPHGLPESVGLPAGWSFVGEPAMGEARAIEPGILPCPPPSGPSIPEMPGIGFPEVPTLPPIGVPPFELPPINAPQLPEPVVDPGIAPPKIPEQPGLGIPGIPEVPTIAPPPLPPIGIPEAPQVPPIFLPQLPGVPPISVPEVPEIPLPPVSIPPSGPPGVPVIPTVPIPTGIPCPGPNEVSRTKPIASEQRPQEPGAADPFWYIWGYYTANERGETTTCGCQCGTEDTIRFGWCWPAPEGKCERIAGPFPDQSTCTFYASGEIAQQQCRDWIEGKCVPRLVEEEAIA